MLNLVDANGQVIGTFGAGGWFNLPDGSVASPATDGWTNGTYSLVAVPQPPAPTAEELLQQARATMRLTFAQLLIGLVTEGWITEAEGEAWLGGTLPAAVLALIATLPPNQQFAAKARALRPSEVLRTDSLVISMATAQGKSDIQLDAFFTTYANV